MINSGQNCKQPEHVYRYRQENLILPPVTPVKKVERGTSLNKKEGKACKVTRKCNQRENIFSEQ